jgi:hypothetical protein
MLGIKKRGRRFPAIIVSAETNMDPFHDFLDVLGAFVAKDDPVYLDLFHADTIRPLLSPLPKVIVVHGKVGSGRTVLVSVIRRLLYADGLCMHVFVDDTLEYTASNKSIRRAVDDAMGSAGVTIISTLQTKHVREGVLCINTRDVMSEPVLRSVYGIGVDRLMRAYDGNLVHLHNHRIYFIPCARQVAEPTEPHTAHALEMCFRRTSCRDDDNFGDADMCLEKANRLEIDVHDTLIASLVGVLVGDPDRNDRRRDRKR